MLAVCDFKWSPFSSAFIFFTGSITDNCRYMMAHVGTVVSVYNNIYDNISYKL